MNLDENTRFKNIFFDFDGVIAESVRAKTDAFMEMYLPYGKEVAKQVLEFHINNGGVSCMDCHPKDALAFAAHGFNTLVCCGCQDLAQAGPPRMRTLIEVSW